MDTDKKGKNTKKEKTKLVSNSSLPSSSTSGASAASVLDETKKEKEVTSKGASDSVVASYKFHGEDVKFVLSGRSTSVVGDEGQGDHVTALALIKKGFSRALNGLTVDDLGDIGSARDTRGTIYDFISTIAVLNLKENEKDLYKPVIEVLKRYNQNRFSKKDIENRKKLIDKIQTELSDEEKEIFYGGFKKEYKANGKYIHESFTNMAEILLTFYNHIPGTAYLKIPEQPSPQNETAALNFLDKFADTKDIVTTREYYLKYLQDKIKRTERNIAESKSDSEKQERYSKQKIAIKEEIESFEKDESDKKLFSTAIRKIADLIFYPEIGEEALKNHKTKTEKKRSQKILPRTNDEGDLVNTLAKHIHIVLAAYPELKDFFGTNKEKQNETREKIISAFVFEMITGKQEDGRGWQKFNSREKIKEISNNVLERVKDLEGQIIKYHLTEDEKYSLVKSSSEESIEDEAISKATAKQKKTEKIPNASASLTKGS